MKMTAEQDFSLDVDGKSFDSNGQDGNKEPCRDFMKNICNRGSRCKFYHPPDVEAKHIEKEDINFCLDYQNKRCLRENCRYVHAMREDAEAYRKSCTITESLARAIAAVTHKDTINGTPFCKEWLSGNCSRGQNRCRYWHVDPSEEKERRLSEIRGIPMERRPPVRERDPPLRGGSGSGNGGYGGNSGGGGGGFVQYPMSRPYDRYDRAYSGGGGKRGRYDHSPVPPSYRPPSPNMSRYVLDLERKNEDLIRENESLHGELKRLKEKYEDIWHILYARGAAVAADPPVITAPQQAAVASGPAPGVNSVSAPAFARAPASGAAPQPPAPAPGAPPVALVSATDAHHLVASLAQQVQAAAVAPLQSIAMSRPSDAAVNWSTMSMRH